MSISEQIDVILASRKNKAEEMKRRKEALSALRILLKQSCDDFYTQSDNIEDEKLRNQYRDIMDEIDAAPVLTRIDKAAKKLDEGVKRFQRDYISIATIGKEGQGKSRLLQAIGDLNGDIIPSGDAGSCTGATSIIWNDASLPQGAVRCRITFRQPEDLVEVVKPYIATLDPTYLESHELDFDSIGAITPILSAGGIDFIRFRKDEQTGKVVSLYQEPEFLPDGQHGYRPQFCEQPLIYSLIYILSRFRQETNTQPQSGLFRNKQQALSLPLDTALGTLRMKIKRGTERYAQDGYYFIQNPKDI